MTIVEAPLLCNFKDADIGIDPEPYPLPFKCDPVPPVYTEDRNTFGVTAPWLDAFDEVVIYVDEIEDNIAIVPFNGDDGCEVNLMSIGPITCKLIPDASYPPAFMSVDSSTASLRVIQSAIDESHYGYWPIRFKIEATARINGVWKSWEQIKWIRLAIYETRPPLSAALPPMMMSAPGLPTSTDSPADPFISDVSSDGMIEFGIPAGTEPTTTGRMLADDDAKYVKIDSINI